MLTRLTMVMLDFALYERATTKAVGPGQKANLIMLRDKADGKLPHRPGRAFSDGC